MPQTETEQLVVSLEARVTQFEKSFQRANRASNDNWRSIENRAKQSGDRLERSMASAASRANAQLSKIGVNAKPITLGVTLGGISGAALATEGAKLADAYVKARNSLKVAGLEGQNLEDVFNGLFDAAQKNSAPISALTGLYGSAAQASADLGASQDDLIKFSSGVAVALKAAGVSSTTASGALTQLGQLLGSGTVHAEEFNSVNEGARPILIAVAKGLDEAGGSVAKLKTLVTNGSVSSKQFFDAFLKGLPTIQAMADNALPTLEQSATRVNNALIKYVGQSDESLGATARLKAGLNALADNFEQTADVALKVAGVIAAAFVGRAIAGMVVSLASAGVAIGQTITALVALRGAATLTGVAGAFAGLGSAAGPIGAILGVAAAAAIYFATRSDGAAEAASRASNSMKSLGVSASSTADDIRKVADELAKLSGAEIRLRIADNSALITQKFHQLSDIRIPETAKAAGRGQLQNPIENEFRKQTALFTSGRIDLDQYKKALDGLSARAPEAAKEFAEAQKAAEDYTAALKTRAAQDKALAEQQDATNKKKFDPFGAGLGAVQAVPGAAGAGADALSEANSTDHQKAVDKQTDDLVKSYEKTGGKITDAIRDSFRQIAERIVGTQEQRKENDKAFDATSAGSAFDLIKAKESFRSQAYYDVNHYRVGYGSDTTTDASGNKHEVTKDTVVSIDDAVRDLKRRIGEFQAGIKDAVGADVFNSLGDKQQAALTSIAYNYGHLPQDIANAVKSGTTEDVAKAIRSHAGDNDGVNRDRRNSEADLYAGGATYQAKQRDTAADFDKHLVRDSGRSVEDINAETDALNRQAQSQGILGNAVSTFDAKAEHDKIVREELRKLADAEIEATPERVAQINALADAQVAASQRRVQAERSVATAQKNTATAMQLVDLEKDSLKGFISDLRQGKSAGEALAGVLDKIADKLIDMAIDSLFPTTGGAGGGGGFLGIFGGIGKLFGFAEGGAVPGVTGRGSFADVFTQDGKLSGPGTGTSDSMLARVSTGEFIVNAKATAAHLPVLEAINSGRIPAFASGGRVGGSSMSKAMRGGDTVNMGDINVNVAGSTGNAKQDADYANRIGRVVQDQVRQEIARFYIDQRRPGGMISHD